MTLAEKAKAHLLAQAAFNQEWIRYWHTVQPCTDEVGWKVMETFRGTVDLYVFKYKRGDVGIKQSAWEVFRQTLTGEAEYSFDDALGFVKWYEQLKQKISRGISHLFDYHGDSYGDLVDSYPLAGKSLAERALASNPKSDRPRREGFLDETEVRESVKELGEQWYKLIAHGENYVESSLEHAAVKAYLHRVLTGRDEETAEWAEASGSELLCVGHFED